MVQRRKERGWIQSQDEEEDSFRGCVHNDHTNGGPSGGALLGGKDFPGSLLSLLLFGCGPH